MSVYQAVFPAGVGSEAELQAAAFNRARRFGLIPTGSVEFRTHHLGDLSIVIATVEVDKPVVKETHVPDADVGVDLP